MSKRESLDEILATDEGLVPSSGFLATVMERVHTEAAAPPPIPFPWKRAVPGVVLAAAALGWGAVGLVRQGLPAIGPLVLPPPQFSASLVHPLEGAGWVVLALGASLASWLVSRRLAGGSGLL